MDLSWNYVALRITSLRARTATVRLPMLLASLQGAALVSPSLHKLWSFLFQGLEF